MSVAVGVDPALIQHHLERLYGYAPADTWLYLWTRPGSPINYFRADDLDHVARSAVQLADRERRNVYVPIALRSCPGAPDKRTSSANAAGIVGFIADIDLYHPMAHAAKALPPDEATALAILNDLPHQPTMIVASGHGLQPWWLFGEPWIFETEAERRKATALARGWHTALERCVESRGYVLDTARDLARVLRLAGTVNRKPNCEPVPVRLLSDSGPRYTSMDFESFLPLDEWAQEPNQQPLTTTRSLSATDRATIVALIQPHWQPTRRHRLSLFVSGWLALHAIAESDAREIVATLAGNAGDDDREDLPRAVAETYASARAGEPIAGWKELLELLPTDALASLDQIIKTYQPQFKVSQNGTRPHDDADSTSGGDGSCEDSPPQTAPAPDLPKIDAGDHDLPRVAAAAWSALVRANNPPTLFRYGGLPTRIDRDDKDAPIARTLTEDRLRHELARAAGWYKQVRATKDDPARAKPEYPPVHVVRDMLAARALPFPLLTSIIEAPAFAPDGSLHDVPGYHPAGQTYYAPRAGFTVPLVPNRPTAAQVAAARRLLVDEVLVDFPFTGEAERAHAVALLVLPFVRMLIDGPTPLHLIEKPAPGTGATLLTDVLTSIATGRPVDAMTEGRDEDEWRKRLTARLRDGTPIILIDNICRTLDSSTVSSAITATEWSDRLLGTSDTVRLPVRCAWVATGNNPALSSEISRRTIRIRLDAKQDRPWLRHTFRHPELRTWGAQHRGELVAAALTMVQAWLAAGRPVPTSTPSLGMFEAWTRVMSGILHTAGIPGFLGNLSDFYDTSDTEGATIRAFLGAWWEQSGEKSVGTSDLFEIAITSGLELGDKSMHSQRIRLGRLLGHLRDRRYQLTEQRTVFIKLAGEEHRLQRWQLVSSEGEVQP